MSFVKAELVMRGLLRAVRGELRRGFRRGEVRLADAADVLERYVASALESCRTVPGGVGEDVVDELLKALFFNVPW
ncbi:hypothetical protein [Streptomyces atratus]